MKKYNIEGSIDFFSELYKSLEDEETNFKTEKDNNLCLITNELLVDKFITMDCGHKFNYIPLFNDLVNHKKKFNNMEGSTTQLKHDEIRCPYCRNKWKGVLPFYEELGLPKIHGVNYIDTNYIPNSNCNHSIKLCEFIKPNIYFNPNSTNIIEFYKPNLNIEDCKFIKCGFMGTQISYYNSYAENYGDEKHYCGEHKRLAIKKHKQDLIDKKKEIKLNQKLKAKEDKEKAKEDKEKAKEELKKDVQLAKMNKKQKPIKVDTELYGDNNEENDNENDNVVIGVSNINLCKEILKTGANKGNPCGVKCYENNLCKRHFNLLNQNIKI
jgi:hypothetical protein